MNPNYNQQQQQQPPYYNYQQHIPGPPQPQWQSHTSQSPSSWLDPRFQTLPQFSQHGQNAYNSTSGYPSQYPPAPAPTPGIPAPPAQPPPRPLDGYNNTIPPQPDTSQWGVKYNQTQHLPQQPDINQTLQPEIKPALPPRPGSSLSHISQHRPPSIDYNSSQPTYRPSGSWSIPSSVNQDFEPPTPPPRPVAYSAASQYGPSGPTQDSYSHHVPTHHYEPQFQVPTQPSFQPQEQYSHHAPTHYYDPQSQPPPVSQAAANWQQPSQQHHQVTPQTSMVWNQKQQVVEGPVSPMEDERRRNSLARKPVPAYIDLEPPSQNVQLPPKPPQPSLTANVQPGVAAFGSFIGGPSDWQHYDPSGHRELEEDTGNSVAVDPHSDKLTASPLQTKPSVKRKSMERIRPQSKPSSPRPQAQVLQQTPYSENAQRIETSSYTPMPNPSPLGQLPDRQHSAGSAVSSISNVGHNESIDNVIQAWSAPLKADSMTQTSQSSARESSSREQSLTAARIELVDQAAQTDFKPQVETKIETRIETKEVEVDPYADIQNEYKATLKRFAGMLRQEAAIENEEEKFKIFQGFVIRELRLRSVLYGVEPVAQEAALRNAPPEPPGRVPAPSEISPKPDQLNSQKKDIEQLPYSKQEKLPPIDTQISQSPSSKDESFVVVSQTDIDDEYSPGGRPRIPPLSVKTPKPTEHAISSMPAHPQPPQGSGIQQSGQISPGTNAPMTLDDYVTEVRTSPSTNAPMVVGVDTALVEPASSPLTGPLNFSPTRPLYQPFRYGNGSNDQIPTVQVHPPTENFAALRHNQATESGRTLIHDTPPISVDPTPDRGHSKTPSGGRIEHEEAFIGLIRAKSLAMRKTANTTPRPESPAILRAGTPAANRNTPSPSPSPSPVPAPPLVKSIQSLRSIIPKVLPSQIGPKSTPHPKVENIVVSLQKLPDNFSFIHARVVSWDKSNRQARARQDAERQARQSQYEEHNDHLFNENQIGYAEIAEMEKRFRLDEADKKYKEDQAELESFTKGVFEFVAEKVNFDIKELTRLQVNAIDLLDLDSTSASKQIQRLSSQSAHTASQVTPVLVTAVMSILLEIHEKLEIRHTKIAEAKFEREKRRKRLELSVLYTNNDKPSIKKLEAEFVKAEKLQIFEEFRKKSERANRLLDSFDRAVVRGLAENQGLVDESLTRLQLLRDLLLGAEENGPAGPARQELLYGPDGGREVVEQISAMVDFILNDSKTLVQLLDKADVLSNDADFDLYVSEARITEASPEKFERLKSEKEAEDRKVGQELTSRLGGITRVPNEIIGLVREVRDKIGTDAGHEERMGKALEAAKRRNTGFAST